MTFRVYCSNTRITVCTVSILNSWKSLNDKLKRENNKDELMLVFLCLNKLQNNEGLNEIAQYEHNSTNKRYYSRTLIGYEHYNYFQQ